ncbi:SDR family NAD(P)-dependent oxidoreductase [Microbacterium album]|uniref:Beta-ketoacyl-ACP reductase n=1 Tax=Microbacterium album TaxID=2053191 RepID=A0A917IDV9_9MICO|nr:SDR family oxidoreductase [Microbacterium album]GGH43122.1 beta-ketoacyl-ACP reductase [Microbacterium album]
MTESNAADAGPQPLAGRVALVAGATGPIGRATVRALASRGASVAALYRSDAAAAEALVAGASDGSIVAVQADLTDTAALDAAVRAVEQRLGAVAILVNAAHPRLAPVPVADASAARIRGELAAVAAHAALCARLVPSMREHRYGRILYVAGALMARAVPGFGAYGAAKAAGTALTRYLALEEGRYGIHANVVAPGRVLDQGDERELSPEMSAAERALRERMALPDFPTSAQVADVAVTLIESEALTGEVLWVTGGEPIWA